MAYGLRPVCLEPCCLSDTLAVGWDFKKIKSECFHHTATNLIVGAVSLPALAALYIVGLRALDLGQLRRVDPLLHERLALLLHLFKMETSQ